jgi:flagellar hook-length control protein FliK
MFSSWARGAEASTPPAQDAFRNIFANRLLARLNSQNNVTAGNDRSLSRLGTTRKADTRWEAGSGRTPVRCQPRKGDTTPAASSSEESRRITAARERRQQELHRTERKPGSQTPAAGLAADQNQATSQASQNQSGGTAANPPQALRDLMAFLQSFPGGSLKIAPEQVPAVASYLKSAGLPQDEVDRLLTPSSSQEISLNATDLQAAWQRVGGQGTAGATLPAQNEPQSPAANQAQETQKIQQTPGYRAVWERLTIPENMLPNLRLALARLGASPEALAQLEPKEAGQGIPLTRVWEVLQNVKNSLTPSGTTDQSGAATGTEPSQSAVLGQQPVSGAEMEEWRQVLLKAGLQPEVVEKLMGQKSPGTQEDLKTSLLAAAPAEEAPPALTEPKPLYPPQNLQMRPFFWQSQNGVDQPQLSGDGSGAKEQNPTAQLATLPQALATGENFAIPTFAAELQGVAQATTGGTAPLSDAGPAWRLLPPEAQESLWTQLQSGVTANLNQGENRVILNLNPPDMGQIQLTLNLSGQDLAVSAVATRPEVAELAAMGMPQLVQALAQQGLFLTDFQVRLQDQPERPVSPVLAGAREKGNAPGGNSSTSSRRRSGEVDRFV